MGMPVGYLGPVVFIDRSLAVDLLVLRTGYAACPHVEALLNSCPL